MTVIVDETISLVIDGEEYEGKLARITETRLGYEDHGIPTAMLQCQGESWGQGAGGYTLGGKYMATFVLGVIDALGVRSWEQVAGKQVMLLYKPGQSYPVEGLKRVVGGEPFLFRAAMTEAMEA